MTGKSIENIDELIKSSSNVLQLTIEHDPQQRLTKSTSEATIITSQPTVVVDGPPSPQLSEIGRCREICCNRSPSMHEPATDKIERAFMKQNSQNDVIASAPNSQLSSPYISGTKTQQLCTKNKIFNLNCAISTNNLRNQKERCSSMSKLLDENHPPTVEFYDLSRTKSFRVDTAEPTPRIFRANDLVIGKKPFLIYKVISF